MDCIFCQIVHGQSSTEKLYEDDQLIVFRDLHPQAPVHQLIVPKKHIATLNDLTETDSLLIGALFQTARQLAQKTGVAQTGYRTVFNCNADGGQAIFHLHLHLLGGRKLAWPPG